MKSSEEVELLRGQRQLAAVEPCDARACVDLEGARTEDLAVAAGRARTTHHGADAGDQLAQAERLDHVVVGSQLEADDAVCLLALGA